MPAPRGRLYGQGFRDHPAHPRHAEAAMLDGKSTDRLEQLVRLADAHDGRSDCALHRAQTRQAREPRLLARMALALAHFAQRAQHHGRQAREIGFHHVIGGAVLECLDRALLAYGAGHEYERQVGLAITHQLERRQAVETGQREVGEHQVGIEGVEFAHEIGAGFDAARFAENARALQRPRFQFRVTGHVFQQQDSEGGFHVSIDPTRTFWWTCKTLNPARGGDHCTMSHHGENLSFCDVQDKICK
jgi:hypothetical protein